MAEHTSGDSQTKSELEWVTIREVPVNAIGSLPESGKEKLFRKVRENPLVPIGCTATVCALGYGLYNFYKGRTQMSQYMMRARVIAQAFTFVAIVAGLSISMRKKNQ